MDGIKVLIPVNPTQDQKAQAAEIACSLMDCTQCPLAVGSGCHNLDTEYSVFKEMGWIIHEPSEQEKETFIAIFTHDGGREDLLELTQDQYDVLKWMEQRQHFDGSINPATILRPTV